MRHRRLAALLAVLVALSVFIPTGNMALTGFGEDQDLSELAVDIRLEDNFTIAEASKEMERYERFFEGYRERLCLL